jgi:hypothetical protein
MLSMASRCPICTAALPRVARYCPRCGLPRRRPSGQPLAAAVVLAMLLIVLCNLTLRAVMIGSSASGTLHIYAPPPPTVEPMRGLDLESKPLLLLDRDVPVREMRLHGVRLGDARSRIPRRFVTRSSADEVQCYDGNAYECRNDAVRRIILNDPAILLQVPCRECLNIFNRFGAPDQVEDLRPEGRILFTYTARGMSVRWNRRTGRIDQIVLASPQ